MAIKTNWIERNNRNYLKDVLPLNTPYSIQVETIKACNFRCNYCAYSSLKIEPYIMQLDVFKNISKGALILVSNAEPCRKITHSLSIILNIGFSAA